MMSGYLAEIYKEKSVRNEERFVRATMSSPDTSKKPKRQLDQEMDVLEAKIAELRVLYEQHFADILPQPPDKLRKEVLKLIRSLLRAPFKNAANRFRLRTLVSRFQTYATYWERVLKQKEEGTYIKDVFKADLRERTIEELKDENSSRGLAEKGLKQLYDSYEAALKKTGGKAANLNFETFKNSLMKQAKQLKEQTGAKKLHYKVVIKDGKVLVKASGK